MPEPYIDPARTKVTLRHDLTPPDPIVIAPPATGLWNFDAPQDESLRWRGEGPRCEMVLTGAVQCELVPHDEQQPHQADRSSI